MRKHLIVGIISVLIFAANVVFSAPQGVPKHIIFKGLNTKAGPLSLDDGESPDCLNVHTNIFGTLIKRAGYSLLSASGHTHISTSPGLCNGLYDFAVNSTTNKLMGYFDGNLYKMDSLDGAFDPIDWATAMANNTAEFDNFEGTLIVTDWSRSLGQSWNGTATVTTDITNMPKCKHIKIAYNRVFAGNVTVGATTHLLRFYFSNSGSYTAWTTASDYETLDAPNGDELMGWGTLKGRLFGLSKYTVNLISDVGGADPIQVTKRVDGTGCGAGRTIKTVNSPTFGESLVWLSADRRLMLYNGSTLVDIGEKIGTSNGQCPFYLQNINYSNIEKAHAQVYEKNGWYVLWVPITSSVDYGLIFDYKTNTLWPLSAQNFHSSAVMKTSTGNDIYVGETTGAVHKWNTSNSDNGSTINGYWTSRRWDFGFAPYLKKMGEIQIVTKVIGDYNLNYQHRYNWSDSWSTAETLNMSSGEWHLGDKLPATLGGKLAQTHRWTIPSAFNLLQIKFSNNTTDPAFEIFSLDLATTSTGSIGD